ncbi:hypothetical protein MJO29_005009 [Puccinia striiformis f. sp. tritici]|nr:hypothetical protein MJO29_005009 [Puccinia striiformis f. sp. tritici]
MVLQGPLPPTTRAKRPKQTKDYKALLALPPLPPSPTEDKSEVPIPSTSYGKLLPAPFRPNDDHARQTTTSPRSSKSSTLSDKPEPPNSPVLHSDKSPNPIDPLIEIIDNLELARTGDPPQ